MKKYLKYIIPLAILILGLGIWIIRSKNPTNSHLGGSGELFASLKIDDATNSQSFDISDFVGKTALEATQSKTKVETNGTGTGAFVVSINGLRADSLKHEFWEFDVNQSEASVGAGSYIVKNHDEIEWKINNY